MILLHHTAATVDYFPTAGLLPTPDRHPASGLRPTAGRHSTLDAPRRSVAGCCSDLDMPGLAAPSMAKSSGTLPARRHGRGRPRTSCARKG